MITPDEYAELIAQPETPLTDEQLDALMTGAIREAATRKAGFIHVTVPVANVEAAKRLAEGWVVDVTTSSRTVITLSRPVPEVKPIERQRHAVPPPKTDAAEEG